MMPRLRILSPKRDKRLQTGWEGFFPYYAGFPEMFVRELLQSAKLPPRRGHSRSLERQWHHHICGEQPWLEFDRHRSESGDDHRRAGAGTAADRS